MENLDVQYVITFQSTNHAIKAEHLLLNSHIKVGIMPVPSQIKAGCGICLRVSKDNIAKINNILENKFDHRFDLYSRVRSDGKYIYKLH